MTEKLTLPYHNMGLLEFQDRFPHNRDCYEYVKMYASPPSLHALVVALQTLVGWPPEVCGNVINVASKCL